MIRVEIELSSTDVAPVARVTEQIGEALSQLAGLGLVVHTITVAEADA